MIGIYKITNTINNMCYIGKSLCIEDRLKQHKNGIKSNEHLQNAIRKYGIENFKFEILEECSRENYNLRERYWINFYDSMNNGYNETSGGENIPGYKMSQESRKKMSEIKLLAIKNGTANFLKNLNHNVSGKRNPMYGKHFTEKSKKKMSNSLKGKIPHNINKICINNGKHNKYINKEELNNYLGEWKQGTLKPSNGFKGHKHSEETKRKISESNKGRTISKETRKKISENRDISGTRNPCYGKKLMNNGKQQKYVPKEDIKKYLDNGWVMKGLSRK